MITAKLKPCAFHGTDCYIYKRVDGLGYCNYGYFKTFPHKKINKVSEKRKEENKVYSIERKEFLALNTKCQVKRPGICTKEATQVHHKKGRIGKLLTDQKHFLAVCDDCHRWTELHPEEAKKMGFSENRL